MHTVLSTSHLSFYCRRNCLQLAIANNSPDDRPIALHDHRRLAL